MPHPSALPVLIAGAGPTGLTLACELARRGVAFRLVEAAPGPRPGSRGKGLQPRSLEVFDNLGVIDRILANGRSAMPIRLTDPDGRTSGGPTYEKRPDVPYPQRSSPRNGASKKHSACGWPNSAARSNSAPCWRVSTNPPTP